MPKTPQGEQLVRMMGWLTWLDAIDAGPHPMDPLLTEAIRRLFAAKAVRDLSRFERTPDLKRRYRELAGRLAREAAQDLQQLAADVDDNDTDQGHPFIPKWGGGPLFEPLSPSVTKWLNDLPPDVAGSLLAGAIASIHGAVTTRLRAIG